MPSMPWVTRPGGPSSSRSASGPRPSSTSPPACPSAGRRCPSTSRCSRTPASCATCRWGRGGSTASIPTGSPGCATTSTASGTPRCTRSRPESNDTGGDPMTDTTAVTTTIVVDAPVDPAFAVFTDDIGELVAARAPHPAGPAGVHGLRAEGGRARLRRRYGRERVPLGARPGLRAPEPDRVQLGHQPAVADRDRPGEDERGRGPVRPRGRAPHAGRARTPPHRPSRRRLGGACATPSARPRAGVSACGGSPHRAVQSFAGGLADGRGIRSFGRP